MFIPVTPKNSDITGIINTNHQAGCFLNIHISVLLNGYAYLKLAITSNISMYILMTLMTQKGQVLSIKY